MNTIHNLDTSPLSRLEKLIEKDLDAIKNHWASFTNSFLSLSAHLKEARDYFPQNDLFGAWIDNNPKLKEIGHQDRAALLNLAKDLNLAKEVLSKTRSKSPQLIWREAQPLYEEKGLVETRKRVKTERPVLNENHNRRRFTEGNQRRKDRDEDDEEEETEEKMEITPTNNVSPLRRSREPDRAYKNHKVSLRVKKGLPYQLGYQFGDGQWRTFDEIATTTNKPIEEVKKAVVAIKKNGIRYGFKCETKSIGRDDGCILNHLNKAVPLNELTTKLKPLVEKLLEEGRKSHTVRFSPDTVVYYAQKIIKQIEAWETE